MFKINTKQVVLGFTILGLFAALMMSAYTNSVNAQVSFVSDPIAAAFINDDGSVSVGTSNVSALYDFNAAQYEITLAGDDYFFSSYTTNVTVTTSRDDKPLIASVDSLNGNLVVVIQDVAGNRVQGSFQFVTYAP